MKKVKVKFINMWDSFNPDNSIITDILNLSYNIEYVDHDPDFIICSNFRNDKDKVFEYCNYNVPRIYISLENFEPDYTLFDYTITTSYANNLDRSIRIPTYILNIFNEGYEKIIHDSINKEILAQKDKFCNLIFGHERDDYLRRKVAEKLSEYKRVDCAGKYVNNMEDGLVVKPEQKEKFQYRYKFSIVLESTDQVGFATEKIWDAYRAYTIPIYCGDKNIKNDINGKAFIDIRDYSNLDALLDEIKRIDNDDVLFMEMISQPFFNNPMFAANKIEEIVNFFKHIFEQEGNSYRRPMGPSVGLVKQYETQLRLMNKLDHLHIYGILDRIWGHRL